MLKMPLVSPSSLAAVGLLPRARWAKLSTSSNTPSPVLNQETTGGFITQTVTATTRPPLVPHSSFNSIQNSNGIAPSSSSSSSSSTVSQQSAIQMSPSRNRSATLNYTVSTPAPREVLGERDGLYTPSGRGKSSSAASEPDVTADVQIGIRSLRKAHPNIHHNSSVISSNPLYDESSTLYVREEDVALQQARTEETVSVLLVMLSSDPPPRPANLALALTLLLELVYIPPPSSTVSIRQQAPTFSPNQIVLLRKACMSLGKAVALPITSAYNDADGNLLLRLLSVTESAAEDEARNSLVEAFCARASIEYAQAPPRCDIAQEDEKIGIPVSISCKTWQFM
jgi:hypothetical protein